MECGEIRIAGNFVTHTQICCQDDPTKAKEMGGACGTYRRDKKYWPRLKGKICLAYVLVVRETI